MHSLHDLNEYIRRVLALNFQQGIWIGAEIAQIGQSKGHFYLDLVQKGEGASPEIIANAQAVFWARDYQKCRNNLGKTLDEVLREGLQVKIKVKVDFNERYGLKLVIEDVEPGFTFGQVELQRRATLRALEDLGLLDRNAMLPLPSVFQKIAIVSAESAAGFQDFREQLSGNHFGYRFDCQLFASAMQGKNVESELPAALEKIKKSGTGFDLAVIIRGGGSRLDLNAFDQLAVCKAVAFLGIPVFTGIGHETDETVLDRCASRSLKTPTAVAEFIVQHNSMFENEVLSAWENARFLSDNLVKIKALELSALEKTANFLPGEKLRFADWRLAEIEKAIPVLGKQNLFRAAKSLEVFEKIVRANDPQRLLRRGFSIVRKNGKALRSISEAAPGDLVTAVLADGEFVAKVMN